MAAPLNYLALLLALSVTGSAAGYDLAAEVAYGEACMNDGLR